MYEKHGAPKKVLQRKELQLPPIGPTDVAIRMLAAPINPSDLNTVEGMYPRLPPKLPAVAGTEGVAEVTEVGSSVTSLAKGDRVIPGQYGFGTWRREAVCSADSLLKIPADASVEHAATVVVNPCTALRMLEDFVILEPGDCVIQNGATSMVGRAVIELARERGIHTINIIRDRPDFASTVEELKALGATTVVTEGSALTSHAKGIMKDLPAPKLGLNCVGGISSSAVARLLGQSGTLVTYGGMSKQPVTASTTALIFKDLRVRGFWLTHWYEEHTQEEKMKMIEYLLTLMKAGKLSIRVDKTPFEEFDDALDKALEREKPGIVKQLLMF